MKMPSSRKTPGVTPSIKREPVATSDIDQSARFIQQLDPLLYATAKLDTACDAVQKEPLGHPNMPPLRASMKELEAALGGT